MADHITRTVQQGFFSRMANSVVGILIGVLMIPGSVLLISWNEYRTIHRTRGLSEAEQVVAVVADAFEIDTTLNDRLVHVTGTVTTEQTLTDPDFGLETKALRLQRQVEMFQWVEHKQSKTRDKLGGGRETVTTYSYSRQWHDGRVNSDSFEERSGHENPPLRYAALSQVTDQATVGAFRLQASLIESKMNSWKDLPFDQTALLLNRDDDARQHYKLDADRLYYSAGIPIANEPQLGDLRIRFRVVEPASVSVLSKQTPEALVEFKTSNGETIEHLVMGKMSAAEMFHSLNLENNMIAWLMRVLGWVLACVGFSLLTGPLKSLASIIPPLGFLVGSVTFFISIALGSIVTLVCVAIAWIAVRPIFGAGLLLLAGIIVYFSVRRAKSSPRQSATLSGPPPVPPPLPNA